MSAESEGAVSRAAASRRVGQARCRVGCPARIDVPRYVRLCGEGKFVEALGVIREKVPFPGVLGRVCPAPCERACPLKRTGGAVAIRALKRIAFEHNPGKGHFRGDIAPSTGKSVAVVGSGPAGLTAAYYLAKAGHRVIAFEALSQPGGMMRTGIPDYRLPQEVLDQEVAEIQETGVEIRTNSPVDSLDSLFQLGFSAVFLALGTHQDAKMGIKGEEASLKALSFLRAVNLNNSARVGERVAVVGGGDTAVDSARVALRLGAKEATILYRRTREDMPAIAEDITDAEEEGVQFAFLTTPVGIARGSGSLSVSCVQMKRGLIDATGRRAVEPIPGTETARNFDTVIMAVGMVPDIPPSLGLTPDPQTLCVLPASGDTLATSIPGVFAGGDCVIGPSKVIEAIVQGRKAASSIDRFLGGDGEIDENLVPPEEGSTATYTHAPQGTARIQIPRLGCDQRQGFSAIELGYTPDQSVEEARRCINCDLV